MLDVVVIGAGPAGSSAAHEVAVLVESEQIDETYLKRGAERCRYGGGRRDTPYPSGELIRADGSGGTIQLVGKAERDEQRTRAY